MADLDDYKQWLLSADVPTLLHQLNSDIKTPLVSAQNLVNMLTMMLNPSPTIQKKIDSGELNREQMLGQITALIAQVFDMIDFYRDTFDQNEGK